MPEIEDENPGDGLARHPHRARPPGDAAPAAARAAPRRRRPAAPRHVPDGGRGRRSSTPRAPSSRRSSRAPRRAARRCRLEVKVGVMLEVPALLWQLPALPRARRFPLGRHQRSGAVPVRRRPRQSAPRRPLRSAVAAVAAGARRGRASRRRERRACRVCGEMAGEPLDAMALVGLGFRVLSMNPGGVGPVKAMVRSLDSGAAPGAAAAPSRRPRPQPAPQAARLRPGSRRRRMRRRMLAPGARPSTSRWARCGTLPLLIRLAPEGRGNRPASLGESQDSGSGRKPRGVRADAALRAIEAYWRQPGRGRRRARFRRRRIGADAWRRHDAARGAAGLWP